MGTGRRMIETLIGQRYRIKALIGEGGMASVYSALDEKLERKVALKILHPHLARNTDIRDRFLLEARTVSGLDHPNILRVYDFSGLESEQLWIVMEILHGEDLSEYVKAFPGNRLHYIVATMIAREICRALHEAHKLSIVHRDIKPENIMILQSGQIKLMDFGIAKVHRANATQTGIFMGSPSYMSPEQIRGTDVDARADIYSLSVLFYEIITGQLPFTGKSTAEVINRIMVGRYTAPNLLITELPNALTQIIQKGLQHHKDERYQSIIEMAQALDHFLSSLNFRESRIELEEFALNRTQFTERIAKVLTSPPLAPNALAPSDSGPLFPSKISRYQATYEQPMDGSTVLISEGNRPTSPPDAFSLRTSALDTPPLAEPQNPASPSRKNSVDAGSRARQSGPGFEPSPSPRPTQTSVPPAGGKASKRAQNPMRPPTQPPKSPSNAKHTHYRGASRGFEDEPKRRASNLLLILGLVAAVAAVAIFIFGGDRVLKQPSTKNVRQELTVKPKKKTEVVPDVQTPPPPPVEVPEPKNEEASIEKIENPHPELPVTPKVKRDPPKTVTIKPQVLATKREPKSDPVIQSSIRPKDTVLASIPQDKPQDDKVPETKAVETKAPEGVKLASIPPQDKEQLKPREKEIDKEKELPKDKPEASGPGTLRLAALPAAEVYLDGKLNGTTNDKQFGAQGIKLDAGTYMLRLKRKGYRTEEQAIQIKPGEVRQINVTLTKLGEFVELLIRANKLPAIVTIEEVKNGGRKRELPMTKHTMPINLKAGSYKVSVSHEGEAISRTMELTDENKSITFNADFK
jgi:serine/threonine protein kinase